MSAAHKHQCVFSNHTKTSYINLRYLFYSDTGDLHHSFPLYLRPPIIYYSGFMDVIVRYTITSNHKTSATLLWFCVFDVNHTAQLFGSFLIKAMKTTSLFMFQANHVRSVYFLATLSIIIPHFFYFFPFF